MLFINLKILRVLINRGDNLKDKQAYKKSGFFWSKMFPVNVDFNLLNEVQKGYHSYLHWFLSNCSSNLQRNLKEI